MPLSTLLLVLAVAGTTSSDGADLLAKCLAYHDPDGQWMDQRIELRIETRYAAGHTRVRLATVDYATGAYRDRVEEDDHVIEQTVLGEECQLCVDGSDDVQPELLEELGLSCERAYMLRDYVSYLWGLPMKLKDPGARVSDTIRPRLFQGHEVLDLTVTYDPEVGTDVWHMYVDPATGRLTGYAFFKTPAEEQGEYIVLEEELRVGSARIPARRHWYRIPGDEFLGTDTLLEGKVVATAPR